MLALILQGNSQKLIKLFNKYYHSKHYCNLNHKVKIYITKSYFFTTNMSLGNFLCLLSTG